ncbi:hypothetical protein BDR05DRAFT_965929 [Suillus weaverae]|nr:hypothetical protein BDR05DRAFT_965929 [Suillus weaverae]
MEAHGEIAYERSCPEEFNPDTQDSFGTMYAGDIPQDRSVSGPTSLQLFLLEISRISLTEKPNLEQSDSDSLHARTRGMG